MSVILRPEQLEGSVLYTVAAAVAARRAIAEYSPDAKIKWVNDVYVKDLKVSGILCEAVSELESGKLEAVICGIGINLTAPEGDFPLDIRGKAGYISDAPIHRGKLAARLAEELDLLTHLSSEELIAEYSSHMMLTGKEIYYTHNNEKKQGRVLGVDSSGGLIVERGGIREILRSGEVMLEKF